MKIWILSVGEPLPTDGANVRLRRMGNLAAYIAQDKENQVDWFSVSFDHYKKKQRVNKDTTIQVQDNYRMHLMRVNGYKHNISVSRIIHHMMAATKIKKEMYAQAEKPDAILLSMEPLEVCSVGTAFARKHDIPALVDVRDLWPEIYYDVIPQKLHALLSVYVGYCKKILSKAMSRADAIIGLSPDFLQYGLKYAGREKTELDAVIPIAYPNYDYSVYKGKYELLNKKYGICEGDFVAVFFGNFGNQFDFEPIIEAAWELKNNTNIKIVLCGTGVQMDSVKERCPSNVIFTGWIEKEEIMSLSANAAVGIAPYIDSKNYRMNTPNKFGEYLSASLPPIIAVGGLMQELLEKTGCGARYDGGKSLAQILLSYLQNPEKLKEESIRARKLYETMFSADVVNQGYLDQIQKVVEVKK